MRVQTLRKYLKTLAVATILVVLFNIVTLKVLYYRQQNTSIKLPEEVSVKNWWKVEYGACQPVFDPNYINMTNQSITFGNKLDRLVSQQLTTNKLSQGRNPLLETCYEYIMNRHFILKSMSEEEKNFPIAYSIVVYKDYPQVEHLLRTIYRPEHVICLHVDAKADKIFVQHLKNLVKCFREDEIFIAKRRVSVVWGTYSTLEADLICMEELWKLWKSRKWKYLINLTGQEYPLRTNLELVRILSLLNGSNAVEGLDKHQEMDRHPKTKLPFNFTWTKGAVHVVLTPGFVNFSFSDSKARAIRRLLKKEGTIQDELFFSTLNYNPQLGAPGAFNGDPETNPYFNRVKEWVLPKDMPNPRCQSGRVERNICILGVLDIPKLLHRPELFVNKFYWDFNNLASLCMQEWYWERTRNEILSSDHNIAIDLTWYSMLPMIRHHQ